MMGSEWRGLILVGGILWGKVLIVKHALRGELDSLLSRGLKRRGHLREDSGKHLECTGVGRSSIQGEKGVFSKH